jgi:hypothetical protein
MGMGSKNLYSIFFIFFIFFRLSLNPDFSKQIKKPSELSDELWKIIEPMVEVQPEKRKSSEEVKFFHK